MSQRQISRSPDLQRLRDEGYDVEISAGSLLVRGVPYVTAAQEVAYGTLVSPLDLADDQTVRPGDHTVWFTGPDPCDRNGDRLDNIIIASNEAAQAGVVVRHQFSSKPPAGYADYHEKMTTYTQILSSEAQAIDPEATALTYPVVEDDDEDSVFCYLDTASSRAGIDAITEKLKAGPVAIVGLGGTGSYILDLVAKTPVAEIHIYDRDRLLQHNAFRAPGAPSGAELADQLKVEYLAALYSKMRRGIVPHPEHVDETNVDELRAMSFVFLAITDGGAKRVIVERLQSWGVPFIDVGMGVLEGDGALLGQLRITTRTATRPDHVDIRQRIPFSDGEVENDYARNIQIAELNALNAALAVIRWKKHLGFYLDLEHEHHAVYQIDGNLLINEDTP